MRTAPKTRLDQAARAPFTLLLWRALRPLGSVNSFMMSGAHPDDEASAMLAALGWRDGVDVSYCCSTRGEGGQNALGPLAGTALGTLRTAEMEAACAPLGLRLYWHSTHIEDPITDFGFSKSGTDTLARWGRERLLARFVEILREERPDVLCPTFLDVPGQHGHHRAMTEAAHDAVRLAADPAFGQGAPWQVTRLCLPAWSGAGEAYDDDLPPPPAHVTIPAKGADPVSGWRYETIGQMSRACHATQGMGQWIARGDERDWPLHIAYSAIKDGADLWDGLPRRLADIDPGLAPADVAIDRAQAAWPDAARVLEATSAALAALRAVKLDAAQIDAHGHRLARKETQLAHAIRVAAQIDAFAAPASPWITPEQSTRLIRETHIPAGIDAQIALDLPEGWQAGADQIHAPEHAPLADPYPARFLPDAPARPRLAITVTAHGITSTSHLPMSPPPQVIPAHRAQIIPDKAVLPLGTTAPLTVRITDLHPKGAVPHLDLPAGWTMRLEADGIIVIPPAEAQAGLIDAPLRLDGEPALSLTRIDAAHVAPRALSCPAQLRLRLIDCLPPQGRIFYAGAGRDRVDHWMRQIGADICDADLRQLDACDTLLIGVGAFGVRTDLDPDHLRAFVEQGGRLVTLYHRPWDGWDAQQTPPRPLTIGQPSLRWRVTDPGAPVTQLAPDALFDTPNKIGAADWDGWVKERGLYFAKAWDPAYRPLISLSDADEAPLDGALLTGRIGTGCHIHSALALHTQLEALVPGAFRFLANILHQPGG